MLLSIPQKSNQVQFSTKSFHDAGFLGGVVHSPINYWSCFYILSRRRILKFSIRDGKRKRGGYFAESPASSWPTIRDPRQNWETFKLVNGS